MTTPVTVSPVRVAAAEGAAALPYPGDEPPAVTAAADRLFDAAQQLDVLRDALFEARNNLPGAWRGTAATTGTAEVDAVRTALDDGIGRLYLARGALLTAADQLGAVRHDIDRIRSDWCRAEGAVRGADLLLAIAVDPVSGAALQQARREADGRRQLAVAGWTAAVARSDSVAADCAAALRASMSGPPVYRTGRGVVASDLGAALGTDRMISDDHFRAGLERTVDDESTWAGLGSTAQLFARASAGELPSSGEPALLAAWWRSRSWAEQQAVLHADPQAVGAADGLPTAARHQANLLYLDRREQTIDAALAAGDPTLADVDPAVRESFGSDAGSDFGRAMAVLALAAEKQNITSVRTQLAVSRSQPVYLLSVATAARGRAVVAIGNPDTADDVATYVPGTGSDVGSLGGELARADAWGAGTAEFSTDRVATIAWVGYQSPPSVPAAMHDSYADAAAPALVAFQQGLRASHQGPPSRNVVAGHSYAALVVAAASTGGNELAADGLLLVAPVGMEVDSVNDLHLQGVAPEEMGSRVVALLHSNDIIQATGLAHPGAPYGPYFGGRVVVTGYEGGPGVWELLGGGVTMSVDAIGDAFGAHGDYQQPGSLEQRTASAFIVGELFRRPR